MNQLPEIKIEDFAKLDLRLATVTKCEVIEGADKLYKLTLDVGELGERVICAGIRQHYKPEDLINGQIIIIANLAPRTLRGVQSQGMLLAAHNATTNVIRILQLKPFGGEWLAGNIPNGTQIW